MKTSILLIYIVISSMIFGFRVVAQEANQALAEAKSAYRAGQLDDTRFALENALREVNLALGEQILAALPTSLGTLTSNPEGDDMSSMTTILTGLYLERSYTNEQQQASILLMTDSPLLAGVNALLSMPAFMLNSDKQKVIRVDGYKSLLQKSEDASGGYSLQIPLSNSLISLTYNGEISEGNFINLANTIPVSALVKLIQ